MVLDITHTITFTNSYVGGMEEMCSVATSQLQGSILRWGYCQCRVSLHVLPVSPWLSYRFYGFLPPPRNMQWFAEAKISPRCEWVYKCVHGALQWAGVPSQVYRHLEPGQAQVPPWPWSGLKMNKCIHFCHCSKCHNKNKVLLYSTLCSFVVGNSVVYWSKITTSRMW